MSPHEGHKPVVHLLRVVRVSLQVLKQEFFPHRVAANPSIVLLARLLMLKKLCDLRIPLEKRFLNKRNIGAAPTKNPNFSYSTLRL